MKNLKLPELTIDDDTLRLYLAMKFFEEGQISLGTAAEIAGYSEQ